MTLPRPSSSLRFVIRLACLGLALPLTQAVRAETDLPAFRSVLIDGAAPLFSLADATGSGRWIKAGESFEGWKVDSYDAATQVLRVSRDGQTKELALEGVRIADGGGKATIAEADEVLQKMRFEEMIGKTLDAQQAAMAKSMGGMFGKDLPEAQRERMVEFQKKVMAAMFEEMDLPGMRNDLAAVYAETFSSAELKAQSDFYSTPAGQAMIEKQPVLQEKMTQIMMPRMMKAMPKIQAMSQEFGKEEAARMQADAEAKKPQP